MTTTPSITLKIIKDYPKPGINFIDINPLLQNPTDFAAVINALGEKIAQHFSADELKSLAVIAPEARGFLFATPVAYKLGLPLLLVRKKGKIPNKPYVFHITNEYDSYDMELDSDLLAKYPHYIYIDDIFATGQTLAGIKEAIGKKGKKIMLALHITAVPALKGIRDNTPALKGIPTQEVI